MIANVSGTIRKNSVKRVIWMSVVGLCVSVPCVQNASAQDPNNRAVQSPQTTHCTDLSDKVLLPCPDGSEKASVQNGDHGNAQAASTGAEKSSETLATSAVDSNAPGPVQLFARDVFETQRRFWTIPFRLRLDDAYRGAPFGIVTGSLIAADTSIERELPSSSAAIERSHHISNYGVAAFAGMVGGSYLWGHFNHDDDLQETGFLAGKAAANSLLAVEALKYAIGRQRPLEGNGNGDFFSGGQSFPSEHAAAAWSIATVFADRYPGTLPTLLSYGAASAISISRITGRNHFSSDVFVGAALGWYFGHEAVRHNGENNSQWGTFERDPEKAREAESRRRDPNHMASPYVPLDSWVYPAFDRLTALGFASTAFAGMRPWTRLECARILEEVGPEIEDRAEGSEEERLYNALSDEFSSDLRRRDGESSRYASVDSVYGRVMGISGKTLNDGYHFGQTIINDYGRQDREGVNLIDGFSVSASADMFSAYFRGEYQHSPSSPALSQDVRNLIGKMDDAPAPPAFPFAALNQFRIPEAYVSMNLGNWQLSYGKQSLWLGPDAGGPMLFSNNAESIPMLHLDRVSPISLPNVLSWLGPLRAEYFLGHLQGQEIVFKESTGITGTYGTALKTQPFINGVKFGFKPTPSLEVGFGYTVLFSGQGVPFNFHTFEKSLLGLSNGDPGTPQDPGDRRSSLDFSYRIPKLRRWLTFYADGFTEDQFSPMAYADRSAWTAGLYLAQVPRLPHLDFRVEGVYTDLPIGGAVSDGFFYTNTRYKEGYTTETNVLGGEGNLIGSWIGRQGQGAQAWSKYWISPKSSIECGFRHQKVSKQFLPEGGTLTDGSVQFNVFLRRELSVSGLFQYEKWDYPMLNQLPRTNFTTSLQVTFWPKYLTTK